LTTILKELIYLWGFFKNLQNFPACKNLQSSPKATSSLSKITSIIFDIICNPTDHLRPDFGPFFSKSVTFSIQIDLNGPNMV
jgi:hypothetical protein